MSFGIAELVVRARYPVLTGYRDFEPGIYADDAERRWANLPGYRGVYHSFFEDQAVAVNALGFRGPEPAPGASSAVHRVLCLGDSNTFGRGVGEAETFPVQLEAELRRRGMSAAVWNSGVCGYDTAQELATLRRYGPLVRPTVVTLGWLENDVHDSLAMRARVIQGYLVEREEDVALLQERIRGRIWEASYVQRLVDIALKIRRARRRMAELAPPDADALAPARLARNLEHVREVDRAARALGARLIVIVYVGQQDVVLGRPSPLPAQVEAALESEGIEVLSAYDLFRSDFQSTNRELFVLRDRGHPNGAGHGLTARAVAERIAPAGDARAPECESGRNPRGRR